MAVLAKCIDGDEVDAFSRRARTWLGFRAGQRARIKRKFNKRVRALGKSELREQRGGH